MMASERTTLDSLPNEVLLSVLSGFPTATLLPLSAVSRRFQAIVLRLLFNRLARAVSADHELILECYHPSAKLSTPYLHCKFLGTGPLTGDASNGRSAVEGPALESEEAEEGAEPSLGQLRGLYSRFRPLPQEEDGRLARRRRARAVQQQQQGTGSGNTAASANAESGELVLETPSIDVHLDEAELFTQLCTVTNLVKLGPRRGIFASHVNISDGLIRVWRDWLGSAAARDRERGPEVTDGGPRAGILWADVNENVGVRFRVSEVTDHFHAPLLVGADDDPPVSYRLEYDELFVRTSQLLLTTEKSEALETVSSAGTSTTVYITDSKTVAVGLHTAQMLFYPANINIASLATRTAQSQQSFDRPRWNWSCLRPTAIA